MTDLFGPAATTTSGLQTGAVVSRPSEDRVFGSSDTWFADCSSPTANDGTAYRSAFFNALLAELRAIARANGKQLDGVTPVLSDANVDTQMLTSLLHLMQRARFAVAVDSGTQNALVAALSPVPPELPDGFAFEILAKYSNTGPTTVRVSGVTYPVVLHGGTALAGGEINGGDWCSLRYNLNREAFQLGSVSQQTSASTPTTYTGTEGVQIASNVARLDFSHLAEEDTIGDADLVAFFQTVAGEGGLAAGVHRKTTFGNFAASVLAEAGRQLVSMHNASDTIPYAAAFTPVDYATVVNNLPNSTFANGVLTIGQGDAGLYFMTGVIIVNNKCQDLVCALNVNGVNYTYGESFTPSFAGVISTSSATFQRLNVGDRVSLYIYAAPYGQPLTNSFSYLYATFLKLGS